MKRLIFGLLIAFIAITTMAQEQPPPTAQLTHYTIKESLPSFIVITNTPTLFPEPSDYYFTYSDDMFCRGGYYAYIDYARAFGDDPGTNVKEGFATGDTIYLGFYDSSIDTYYNLITDLELTYKSLGLYKVVALKGLPITLNINPALTDSEIKYTDLVESQDIYRDENVFFNIIDKNVTNLTTEIVQGGGTLKVVDRWVTDHFVNRQYTAVESDTVAVFETTGEDIFTGDIITVTQSIKLTSSKPNIPNPVDPEVTTLFTDANVNIWMDDKSIWVNNLSGEVLTNYITFTKDGRKLSSNIPIQPGKEVRGVYLPGVTNIKLVYYKINGARTYIMQDVEN